MIMANLLLDLVKAGGTIVAVLALIFIFPFVLMWFFRRATIGTQKDNLYTIRKIR